MTYPFGTPSEDVGTGIYVSDFSPTIVSAGLIDNYTPISNIGLRNSLGYQVSLLQNFICEQSLGRDIYRVQDAWLDVAHVSGVIDMDTTSEDAYIRSSGALHFMSPEAATAGLTVSGNYVGINHYNPSYELELNGTAFLKSGGGDGIEIRGDNGVINRLRAEYSDESRLYLQTGNGAYVHVNDGSYGGTSLTGGANFTQDEDVWSSNITFSSGNIDWSDCDISGFASYT